MLYILPIQKYTNSTYYGEKIIEVLLSHDNRIIIDTDFNTYIAKKFSETIVQTDRDISSDYILCDMYDDLNLNIEE